MPAKPLLGAMLVFGAMTGTVLAAPPAWQGTFFVTAVGSGCPTGDVAVGDFGTMLYRPIINAGDPAEGMSFFQARSAATIISQASSGSFKGAVTYNGVQTGHWSTRTPSPERRN